jgi:amidase
MKIDEARRQIKRHALLNAFIAESEEAGGRTVIAVKDVIDVRGMVTTLGVDAAHRPVAERDAVVVERARAGGCVVVGKTNLHPLAFGVTSANPRFGPVRNPRDPQRIAGGSSGGSAVAAAAGMCDWALGTDTGGSNRIPASLCGVVAVKPTVGLLPQAGIAALSPTLDTVGPIARDVATAAQAFGVLTQTTPSPASRVAGDLSLGWPRDWVGDLDRTAGHLCDGLAPRFEPLVLPDREAMNETCLTILLYEAAREYASMVESANVTEDTKVLLTRGLQVTDARYAGALRQRDDYIAALDDALGVVEALVLPATPCVAPTIADTDVRSTLTRFTRPFSLTGHPVVVVPGPVPDGALPVGVQLVGARHTEERLLAIAAALESEWMPAVSTVAEEGLLR